jgi:hypothetical protein
MIHAAAASVADLPLIHVMRARRIPVCWSTDFRLAMTGVSLVIDRA